MDFILLLCLLCLSLLPVTAVPVLESRQDDVGIESVNLVFNSGCPSDKQGKITAAWEDAVRLASNVGTVDFNDVAAIEFFGPPALNQKFQKNIQAVFDAAKTFSQGWRITPTPLKVQVNVGCGPDGTETNARCARNTGIKAYTWNTKNTDGSGSGNYLSKDAVTNMYICNSFFFYEQLDDRIKEYKDDSDYHKKYNMDYYRNMGYVILHELMHSNRLAYAANGNRHIVDMEMNIYQYVKNPDDRNYRRRLVLVNAYGAMNTKILARTSKANIATDITLNADSFAQYVLSKYVQSKIGGYPWLPIAEGQAIGEVHPRIGLLVLNNDTEWGLNGDTYESVLKDGDDDITFTFSDSDITINSDEENTLSPLVDLEWTPDDEYPEEYIKQVNEWADKAGTTTISTDPTPSPVPEPAPTPAPIAPANPQCNGLSSKKYVSQPRLADNIKDFCSQAIGQGVQDTNSGSIVRTFNQGSRDEVSISVDWPPGKVIPFNEEYCNTQLNRISDDCDGNDPANPMNWKGGGQLGLPDALYHINPQALRQPLPNTPSGSCDVQYKFLFDEFWIWGNGYATWDYGQSDGGLLQQVKGCDGLSDWSFSYGLGSDGREWSAHGKLLIGKAGCVGRAIESAGGPKDVDCSGDS